MSFSVSETYTIADIGKVVDRVAADLGMAAASTGLMRASKVADYIADIKMLAQKGYIDRVDIVLENSVWVPVRVAKYEASTDASFWAVDRPGNMMWPDDQHNLGVIVHYTEEWADLSEQAHQRVRQDCRISWGPSQVNTNYPHMISRPGRRYASKGYGMERTDLEAL